MSEHFQLGHVCNRIHTLVGKSKHIYLYLHCPFHSNTPIQIGIIFIFSFHFIALFISRQAGRQGLHHISFPDSSGTRLKKGQKVGKVWVGYLSMRKKKTPPLCFAFLLVYPYSVRRENRTEKNKE